MGPYVRVYKDRLGRDLRSVTESFDGSAQASGKAGAPVYKDALYNLYGVKVLETQAYFAATGSSTTTGANDVGFTQTVVDALGRPTILYVADPNGQNGFVGTTSYGNRTVAKTTIAYTGLSVTTTNDRGQARTEEKNALGELVRVTDATGATLIHQRDAFGNLVQTLDALGNTTTLVYDLRGRKTQLQDPDTGVWNYAYDALGELVCQQSPNQFAAAGNQATCSSGSYVPAGQTTMAYDVLGRLTSRSEPEYVSSWTYDKNADGSACMPGSTAQGLNGKGKLCQSGASNGVSRQYVYDGYGRPSSARTTVTNGPSFGSAVSYDPATGRLLTQTYPTGVQVGYAYTARGFLEKLLLNTAATITPLPNASGQTASGGTFGPGKILWQTLAVNARGQLETQQYGDSALAQTVFEAATGRVTDLTTTSSTGGRQGDVLSQHYTWDSLNNLTGRNDANGDGNTGAVTETFAYGDNLNRLTSYTVSANALPNLARTVNLQYNALGMLLYKSDVGNYTYNAQGGGAGSHPHALQSVAGAGSTSYTFDANGNLSTASDGKYRALSYTSFNLPDSSNGLRGINNQGLNSQYTWQYDENHARIKETHQDANGTRTTWYQHPDNQGSLAFESETAPSGAISNRHYLSVGGQAIAVLVTTGQLPTLSAGQTTPAVLASVTVVKLEYWHKDHLGSLITTTDHYGAVTARYAYDPFGKRRYTNGTYDSFGTLIVDWSPTVNAGTDRGFTGHEHLDDVGIVHMNGRLFDPTLGVFMQADPLVQDPFNLQNYNRYGYCYNNPMGCTDPSGFCFLGCFWQPKHWGVVGKVVVAYFAYTVLGPLVGDFVANYLWESGLASIYTAATIGGVAGPAAAGFVIGAVNSGSVEGGIQGAFSAAAFNAVGDFVNGSGSFAGGDVYGEKSWQAVVLHGVVGCVTSAASGSKCGPGALSAAFSQAALPYKPTDFIGGTITSYVIGGTASVLGGGKFSNGGATAAFGYLFNHWAHRLELAMYGQEAHRLLQEKADEAGYVTERKCAAPGYCVDGRFDIADSGSKEVWEIKRNSAPGIAAGGIALDAYTSEETGLRRGGDLAGLGLKVGQSIAISEGYIEYKYTNVGGGLIVYDRTDYTPATKYVPYPNPFPLPFPGRGPKKPDPTGP
nr:RHS repeat-associated core domain-containing protein [Pelomonas aquatica]